MLTIILIKVKALVSFLSTKQRQHLMNKICTIGDKTQKVHFEYKDKCDEAYQRKEVSIDRINETYKNKLICFENALDKDLTKLETTAEDISDQIQMLDAS